MDGQDHTHVLVETSALDLLLAMVRIAPDGEGQGEALSGYRSAYDGNTPPNIALTKSQEYQRGYFCCNRNPMTTSERQREILALMSIMIEIEQAAAL